jgi:hypothetical protein
MSMRRPGRPALDPDDRPSVAVTVRFTERQFDSMWAAAQRERMTVSDLIRRKLDADDRQEDEKK